MASYYLRDHVHLYADAEAAILLDLKRDQYIGLDAVQLRALSTILHGWPAETIGHAANEDAIKVGDSLVDKGLLTRDESLGKAVAFARLEYVEASLVTREFGERAKARLMDFANLLVAFVIAAVSLRFRPLERIVLSLRKRKSRHSACAQSLEELRRLTDIFLSLRIFIYTPMSHCLLDSLVLTMFLQRYGFFPTFVFGVKPNPFAAHAWVQYDRYVLNTSPEFARRFAPIMAI